MYYETQPKLLRLDLQHFAEDKANSSDATVNTDDANPNGEGTKQPADHMIPKSRFDEVNQRSKELQEKLDALLADKLDAERKSQEEAGEYQKLYETTSKEFTEFKAQFESAESRNKSLEGVINGLLETKLLSIPDKFHDLIPDNLTPEAKLEWISKAETKGLFGKEPQQPIGEQTNGNEQTGITKEQFQKMKYTERTKLFATNPDLYRQLSR